MDLRAYMAMCCDLARAAAAAGEVPVGALVLRGDEVVATAANRTEAGVCAVEHAELLAIRAACDTLGQKYLTDCTLFVTMEPCPMCAGAIILARVGRVVFGCPDSRLGALGSVFNPASHRMSPHHPEVIGGIMEDECRALLQNFFQARR